MNKSELLRFMNSLIIDYLVEVYTYPNQCLSLCPNITVNEQSYSKVINLDSLHDNLQFESRNSFIDLSGILLFQILIDRDRVLRPMIMRYNQSYTLCWEVDMNRK